MNHYSILLIQPVLPLGVRSWTPRAATLRPAPARRRWVWPCRPRSWCGGAAACFGELWHWEPGGAPWIRVKMRRSKSCTMYDVRRCGVKIASTRFLNSPFGPGACRSFSSCVDAQDPSGASHLWETSRATDPAAGLCHPRHPCKDSWQNLLLPATICW